MNNTKKPVEIQVTLTPYQVEFLHSMLDKHLNNMLTWNREMVMVEGMMEQFEGIMNDLSDLESFDRDLLIANS